MSYLRLRSALWGTFQTTAPTHTAQKDFPFSLHTTQVPGDHSVLTHSENMSPGDKTSAPMAAGHESQPLPASCQKDMEPVFTRVTFVCIFCVNGINNFHRTRIENPMRYFFQEVLQNVLCDCKRSSVAQRSKTIPLGPQDL